jgi:hypothetical protein
MLGGELTVLAQGADYLFVAWRDAYILDWRGTVSVESLDASVNGARTLLRSYRRIATVNILHPPMQLPPPELRDYAKKKMMESPAGVACHATIIPEAGFWASAMRGALTGIYMLERTTFPRRVFGEVRDAAIWCMGELAHDNDYIAGLVGACDKVQRACAAHVAA